MCTMAINKEFNGIELTFESKPVQEIREALKAAGFRWHHQKSLWYAKNTAGRMELAKKLSGWEAPEETAPAKKKVISKFGINPGDILCDSWGYEQTNVEFYEVTKILSPSRVEIVKIGYTLTKAVSGMSSYVIPDRTNRISEPIEKIVAQSRYEKQSGQWHIKISRCIELEPWSGEEMYCSWYY